MNFSNFNKNFIKDLKLPIAVSQEPYFSHFLELINPYYDSINKYKTFVESFEANGKEKFFEDNKFITNSLLDHLKNKPEYLEFNSLDIKKYQKELKISSKDLYKPDNQNKKFVSIDLVKANFQSIHFVVPTIFDGANDYNTFVSNFGFNDYMLISKQIRQIIFGNMNPQRQQKIQSYMMNKIAEELINIGVDINSIYSLSSDELVFEDTGITREQIEKTIKTLNFEVKIEFFTLERPFMQPMYVKKIDNGDIVIKMVPTSLMAEFIKRFEGRELEDLDFFFMDENKRLSKYVSPFIENK
jgi:hypothetical protein